MRYAIVGRKTNEMLSYRGKILVHGDKAEMEYLFPNERIVKVPSSTPPEDTMPLTAHPGMAAVQFPLDKHMDQFIR